MLHCAAAETTDVGTAAAPAIAAERPSRELASDRPLQLLPQVPQRAVFAAQQPEQPVQPRPAGDASFLAEPQVTDGSSPGLQLEAGAAPHLTAPAVPPPAASVTTGTAPADAGAPVALPTASRLTACVPPGPVQEAVAPASVAAAAHAAGSAPQTMQITQDVHATEQVAATTQMQAQTQVAALSQPLAPTQAHPMPPRPMEQPHYGLQQPVSANSLPIMQPYAMTTQLASAMGMPSHLHQWPPQLMPTPMPMLMTMAPPMASPVLQMEDGLPLPAEDATSDDIFAFCERHFAHEAKRPPKSKPGKTKAATTTPLVTGN